MPRKQFYLYIFFFLALSFSFRQLFRSYVQFLHVLLSFTNFCLAGCVEGGWLQGGRDRQRKKGGGGLTSMGVIMVLGPGRYIYT